MDMRIRSFILCFLMANGSVLQVLAQQFERVSILDGNVTAVSMDADGSGSTVTMGNFWNSIDCDPGTGIYPLFEEDGSGIFISKLDADGDFVWALQLGSDSDAVSGDSHTIDVFGNVCTAGTFRDTVDFDPGPAVSDLYYEWHWINLGGGGPPPPPFPSHAIFVSKLDSSGNFVWARMLEGSGQDGVSSIETDASGNIYLTGYFLDTADFDPGPDTFNLIAPNVYGNAFVCKWDPDGNFIWAKSWGESSFARGIDLGFDTFGNPYVIGAFYDTVNFYLGDDTVQLTQASGGNVFISKLDPDGNLLWVRQSGGAFYGSEYRIAVDSWGNVLTAGRFHDADFNPGADTFMLSSMGFSDIFISKLDADGNFVWAKQVGGQSSDETSAAIAVDADGNVYMTGHFRGSFDFDPGPGIFDLQATWDYDVFVLKLRDNGDFEWVRRLGGAEMDLSHSLALDSYGHIYTAGRFNGTADFDPGADTFNVNTESYNAVFIQKMGNCSRSFSSLDTSACGAYTSPGGDHTWTESGTYSDTIPNVSGCDSVISIDLTILHANTSVTIDLGSLSLTANAADAAFRWLDCNDSYSPVSGAADSIFTPAYNSEFAAEVTQGGCTDTSDCYSMLIGGVSDQFSSTVNIYPNPTDGHVIVEFGEQYEGLVVNVRNVLGQLMTTRSFESGHRAAIEIKGSVGIYLVEIMDGKGLRSTFRIVKR